MNILEQCDDWSIFFLLPLEEFAKYFDYIKELEFIETPDYDRLKNLFQSVYKREKFLDDNLFDWSTALM